MEPARVKPVGIWIRVSTEDQAKGESPEHHEKRARFYASPRASMDERGDCQSGVAGRQCHWALGFSARVSLGTLIRDQSCVRSPEFSDSALGSQHFRSLFNTAYSPGTFSPRRRRCGPGVEIEANRKQAACRLRTRSRRWFETAAREAHGTVFWGRVIVRGCGFSILTGLNFLRVAAPRP